MKSNKQSKPITPLHDVLFYAGHVRIFGVDVCGMDRAGSCLIKHTSGHHGHITKQIERLNRAAYYAETPPEHSRENPSAEEMFYRSKIVSVYPADFGELKDDLFVVTTYLHPGSWNRSTMMTLLSEQSEVDWKLADRLRRFVIDRNRFVTRHLTLL